MRSLPRPKFIPCMFGTLLAAGLAPSQQAFAAKAALEEVIVTAQKRDESVQEVPVSITALTQEALQTNRVANVADLNGLAPNLTVRQISGGQASASFSMRGITSYGVVPGSDKEISIYLDGVYISSPRGSIFSLPDIAQLEVLRGPQGTLFGRNATAGAINIVTRDPAGALGLRQELSYGNNNYQRTRTSVDSPSWGPFSFTLTYANEERDGDIKNRAAEGLVWDRTAFGDGTAHVPKRFGDKDAETYFFATKFEPTDVFSMVYKFDKSVDHGTPSANVLLAYNSLLAPLISDPSLVQIDPQHKRPSSALDTFATTSAQFNSGHSLTSVFDVNDHVSVKNITAFRESQISSASELTGLGGITLGGAPFCVICSQPESDADQWSTELQVNYESDALTLTVGALYFESEDRDGRKNAGNTMTFTPYPGYVVPVQDMSVSYNNAQSLAAYTQLEYHLTDEVDLVGGFRWTRDRKDGDYVTGLPGSENHSEFDFEESRPSYVLGVNYKPAYDTLIYGKYSNAFVSGGSVAGIGFDSEIAKSWEAGIKSDFFDSSVRSNLSMFYVTYEHVQSAQGGTNIGHPEVSTAIIDQGETKANGFEWEGSALLGYGVTVNASLGYTHVELKDVPQVLLNSVQGPGVYYAGSSYEPALIPDWTGALSAQYESAPLMGQAYFAANIGATWHTKIRMEPNPARADANPDYLEFSPESYSINGRAALKDIDLGFAGGKGEIALWGRNLVDNDEPIFALNFGGLAQSAQYGEKRSYGIDFIAQF